MRLVDVVALSDGVEPPVGLFALGGGQRGHVVWLDQPVHWPVAIEPVVAVVHHSASGQPVSAFGSRASTALTWESGWPSSPNWNAGLSRWPSWSTAKMSCGLNG